MASPGALSLLAIFNAAARTSNWGTGGREEKDRIGSVGNVGVCKRFVGNKRMHQSISRMLTCEEGYTKQQVSILTDLLWEVQKKKR